MTISNYTTAKTEEIFDLRIENRVCYKKFEDCSIDSKDELTLIYFTQGIFQRQTDPWLGGYSHCSPVWGQDKLPADWGGRFCGGWELYQSVWRRNQLYEWLVWRTRYTLKHMMHQCRFIIEQHIYMRGSRRVPGVRPLKWKFQLNTI